MQYLGMKTYGKLSMYSMLRDACARSYTKNIKKYDLSKILLNSKHFISEKQSLLYDVPTKCEFPFGRSLVTWKTKPVYT